MTTTETTEVFDIAKELLDTSNEAAVFCLLESEQRLREGRNHLADTWALDSLRYSVGVFHPDYTRARQIINQQLY